MRAHRRCEGEADRCGYDPRRRGQFERGAADGAGQRRAHGRAARTPHDPPRGTLCIARPSSAYSAAALLASCHSIVAVSWPCMEPGDHCTQVEGHPQFQRDGPDVHVTVPVSVPTAALGGSVNVPTITGEAVLKVRHRFCLSLLALALYVVALRCAALHCVWLPCWSLFLHTAGCSLCLI